MLRQLVLCFNFENLFNSCEYLLEWEDVAMTSGNNRLAYCYGEEIGNHCFVKNSVQKHNNEDQFDAELAVID